MSNFHTRHQFITCETDRPTISRSVLIPNHLHTYYQRVQNSKQFVIMEAAIQVTQSLNGKYFPQSTPGKSLFLWWYQWLHIYTVLGKTRLQTAEQTNMALSQNIGFWKTVVSEGGIICFFRCLVWNDWTESSEKLTIHDLFITEDGLLMQY